MDSLGYKIRLNRLMSTRMGRFLDVTIDHGIARGVLPGLENTQSVIDDMIAGRPDAINMAKGIAERCFSKHAGSVPLIIKCSSYSPFHHDYDAVTTTVDEAVRLGADAVSIGALIGTERQDEMIATLGQFVRAARLAGVPTIAHIYPRGVHIKEGEETSMENVRYACRVGAEIGIDIIKTLYTGSRETFQQVVEACPSHVVAAGGIDSGDLRSFLQRTKDIVDAGAAGLAAGRYVWSYKDTPALIRSLKHIIHEDGSVDAALTMAGE